MDYNWKDGTAVFCRVEQEDKPHDLSSQDSHHVVCQSCGNRLHGGTLVVNFSTDEDRPASVVFPKKEK